MQEQRWRALEPGHHSTRWGGSESTQTKDRLAKEFEFRLQATGKSMKKVFFFFFNCCVLS